MVNRKRRWQNRKWKSQNSFYIRDLSISCKQNSKRFSRTHFAAFFHFTLFIYNRLFSECIYLYTCAQITLKMLATKLPINVYSFPFSQMQLTVHVSHLRRYIIAGCFLYLYYVQNSICKCQFSTTSHWSSEFQGAFPSNFLLDKRFEYYGNKALWLGMFHFWWINQNKT